MQNAELYVRNVVSEIMNGMEYLELLKLEPDSYEYRNGTKKVSKIMHGTFIPDWVNCSGYVLFHGKKVILRE